MRTPLQPMLTDRQLSRVVANRQPRVFARRLGTLLGAIVDRQKRSTTIREAVRGHVEAVTDSEFQSRCTVGPIRGEVLTILVDDARWVQPIRERWLFALLDQLQTGSPRTGIRRIEFRAAGNQGRVAGNVERVDGPRRTGRRR